MKIASIAYSVPSKKFSNDACIEDFRKRATGLSEKDANVYFGLAKRMLEYAGAKFRFARDIEAGETAHEHIIRAGQEALAKADAAAEDIDLLLYCGVGRGFIEPANSYFYAHDLGMRKAECFDIVDACMSWVRAMDMAQLYLSTGRYRKVMILTGEFHRHLRSHTHLPSINSLKYNFPTYTIGEAATATIVEASDSDWSFHFASRPEHADLCTIPIEGYEQYVQSSDRIGLNGIGKFVSFGQELIAVAAPLLIELSKLACPPYESIDIFIPHAPAKTPYIESFKALGVPIEKLYCRIFEEFGNLVASSIPTAIAVAESEGLIKRGNRICLIPASAGASVALVTFNY